MYIHSGSRYCASFIKRESLAQCENRVKPQVYVDPIYLELCMKKHHCVNQNWRKENKFDSMWVQSYKNPFFMITQNVISAQSTSFITICFAAITLVIVLA